MFLNKLFLIAGVALLIAAFSVAVHAEQTQITAENAQEFVSFYNSSLDKIPGWVKGFLGNEVIEVNISYDDGTSQQFGVRTKDALITSWQPTPYADTTIALTTSEATISKIGSSASPAKEFKAQWGKGIKYESRHWFSGIKLFFANLFIGFA